MCRDNKIVFGLAVIVVEDGVDAGIESGYPNASGLLNDRNGP